MALSAVQEKMLAGPFYIDGWHNVDFLEEAEELVARGLLRRHRGGDSQRTSYHYEPIQENLDGLG